MSEDLRVACKCIARTPNGLFVNRRSDHTINGAIKREANRSRDSLEGGFPGHCRYYPEAELGEIYVSQVIDIYASGSKIGLLKTRDLADAQALFRDSTRLLYNSSIADDKGPASAVDHW
jgi:hypothetical protein